MQASQLARGHSRRLRRGVRRRRDGPHGVAQALHGRGDRRGSHAPAARGNAPALKLYPALGAGRQRIQHRAPHARRAAGASDTARAHLNVRPRLLRSGRIQRGYARLRRRRRRGSGSQPGRQPQPCDERWWPALHDRADQLWRERKAHGDGERQQRLPRAPARAGAERPCRCRLGGRSHRCQLRLKRLTSSELS